MCERAIPKADDEIRFAGHRGMYCIPGQQVAQYCVVAVRRNAAYEVTWIEILHVYRDLCAFEVRDDLFLQVNAYVCIALIARSICLRRKIPNQLLSRALRDCNYRVMSRLKATPEGCKKTVLSRQDKRHFRDQTEIHFLAR